MRKDTIHIKLFCQAISKNITAIPIWKNNTFAGLTNLVASKVLSELGFVPRLYNAESIIIYPLLGDDRENEIKRIMHYYVESGSK